MGLDMYLRREHYIHTEPGYKVVVKKPDNKVIKRVIIKNADFGLRILEPVGYWRKANAIHQYLLGCAGAEPDAQEAWVYGHQLKTLKEDCETVLKDHSKAKELLPTCDGFFFGSTEYDDYYFEQLQKTIDIIDEIDDIADYELFQYCPSW